MTENKKNVESPKKLPVVPESVMRRRKTRSLNRISAIEHAIRLRAERGRKRRMVFQRAEQYVKEYLKKEQDEIRLKREAKKAGNYYVPGESKLAFVIRIRGLVFICFKLVI